VHPARLKQHGRRFPLSIFEMLTSTLRPRVSGFLVELTQRTNRKSVDVPIVDSVALKRMVDTSRFVANQISPHARPQ
jgi:hypothetical protein